MNKIRYCVICGKQIEENLSTVCSENCGNLYSDSKKKSEYDVLVISGFCNFCGKSHDLIPNERGIVPLRHPECYQGNHPFSKKYFIEKLREKNRRKIFEEKSHHLLSPKILIDKDSHLLICPICSTYSVEYLIKSKEWFCNLCDEKIDIDDSLELYNLSMTDKDKYNIYRYWGIYALCGLTGNTYSETKTFISSYFENGCTSIGDNCLYYDHFKEANAAKQIRPIDNLFEKSKQDCNSLRNEINSFLDSVEDVQLHLSEYQEKLLKFEYVSIKQTIEALYGQIEDYVIAVANTEIKKGEKVFLREKGTDLLADIGGETFDGFCWNYAKKGSFVGICTAPSYGLNQTKQMFEDFKINFEQSFDITKFKKIMREFDLSSLEHETISLIIQNDGILQSSLRKQLGINSKKCSRLVHKLMDQNLIHRIPEIYSGRNTYRIQIKYSSR